MTAVDLLKAFFEEHKRVSSELEVILASFEGIQCRRNIGKHTISILDAAAFDSGSDCLSNSRRVDQES